VGQLVRDELSRTHVFIQSTSSDRDNRYLWEHYGDHGRGVCLRLSTSKFIQHLNTHLPDFGLLPDYFKCCYVMYDTETAERLLHIVKDALLRSHDQLGVGSGEWIVWFFYVEYFRNLVKLPKPYAAEMEVRLMVSDNYSLFLWISSTIARWGLFKCSDKVALSQRFEKEYLRRRSAVHSQMGLGAVGGHKFVKIPLHCVLDSIALGPNCRLTKDEIGALSNGKVRKSHMTRSYLQI
jgi:hypothetical protein